MNTSEMIDRIDVMTTRTWIDNADDLLSRAASAVLQIQRAHAEAAHYDAGFDGGEFSGPAHARMEQEQIEEALAKLGFTPRTYNVALEARTSSRFAFVSQLYAQVEDEN